MTKQPTESFVPLTAAPAPPERREFNVRVIAGAEKAPASFHSLEAPRPERPKSSENKICEPRVTVQRDADRVTHLRIQCTCGQIMDLACVYDEQPPAA